MQEILYAFAHGYIKTDIFEKWLYSDYMTAEAENMQIFGELTECDYKDKNSVLHIKKLLCEAFSEEFSLCEKRGIISETAKKMIDESEKQPEDICIRLYDISDKKQLHNELKRAFSVPEWYGCNRDAFADLLSLSGVKAVELDGYSQMHRIIPDEAEFLLSMLINEKDRECKLIIT
ncbi:MAG: barstar family protein [Oscillospiraceae bacterium]|nr:barstar family protein [Oscillospiraceae bacterium]